MPLRCPRPDSALLNLEISLGNQEIGVYTPPPSADKSERTHADNRSKSLQGSPAFAANEERRIAGAGQAGKSRAKKARKRTKKLPQSGFRIANFIRTRGIGPPGARGAIRLYKLNTHFRVDCCWKEFPFGRGDERLGFGCGPILALFFSPRLWALSAVVRAVFCHHAVHTVSFR